MSTFVKLVTLYENFGLSVQSSLSPAHFPGFSLAEIPFTYIYDGDQKLSKGGGISLSEIAFFEALFEHYHPRNILVIGNSLGWSTLALGLINPDARVVAIDLCPREAERRGIEITNMLGRYLEADVLAIEGRSPDAVRPVVESSFDGLIDFVFIDGGHTNDQMQADFNACRAVAGTNCVYVFHDVINFQMTSGFNSIANNNRDLRSALLHRTPSGMGIAYPRDLDDSIRSVIFCFSESDRHKESLWLEGKARLDGKVIG